MADGRAFDAADIINNCLDGAAGPGRGGAVLNRPANGGWGSTIEFEFCIPTVR
jgi:hypothetical protein